MESFLHNAPFGPLSVSCESDAVTAIAFLPEAECGPAQSVFARQVEAELNAYFSDPRFVFTVPIRLVGTPFQQRLWQALRAIPAGEVRRYGDLSVQLDSSARAVGGACRHNPIPLIVPCHRVVSATGEGGFAGAVDGPLLTIKRWLLRHEGVYSAAADRVGQTADLFAVSADGAGR